MNSFKAFRTQWGTTRVMIATESVQPITDTSAQNPDDHNIHGMVVRPPYHAAVQSFLFQPFFHFFSPFILGKVQENSKGAQVCFLK